MVGEFLHYVPQDMVANLAFRRELLTRAKRDKALQRDLIEMCRLDIAFWLGAFCWTYDPRKAHAGLSHIPFIPYEFQVERVLKPLDDAWGARDVCFTKSRDMGASWLLMAKPTHEFLFGRGASILAVSRNESYVDDATNPKALFWKIDYLIEYLPVWMAPPPDAVRRVSMSISNAENGCVIDGESTTGNVGRGDRRTAIILDEFAAFETADGYRALASTRDTTRCRLFNSTFLGTDNAFYETSQNPHIVQIRLPWWLHPEKSEGLYAVGEKKRSPWYDNECARAASPKEIAQELDMDPLASADQFFDTVTINGHITRHAKPPLATGDLVVEVDGRVRFREGAGNCLKVWDTIDATGRILLTRDHGIGCDIAAGTGASNSVATIIERDTGRIVAEYTSPNMRPEQFADKVYDLARWAAQETSFSSPLPAMVVYDAKGPGAMFHSRLVERGFSRFWVSDGTIPGTTAGKVGFHFTPQSKRALFDKYNAALVDDTIQNPSRASLDECASFVYDGDTVVHSAAKNSIDPSGARSNHGDRVTAAALAMLSCRYTGRARAEESKPVILPESFAWRRRERERKALGSSRW